ncbi:MAG: class I SAM-dependent methyltransferase [Parcubacteria group bacterium]|nr:class I SAM-dependent methyltransferase [Parcubacteria group bacterium]
MISFLKHIARKSAFARAFYWKTIFLAKAVRHNFFFPRRLMLFLKVRPFTMVSYERLKNAYELAEDIEKRKIAGAFVECGVWKGGAAAVMASVAGPKRQIWLFDSFEGLPEPTLHDGARAKEYASNRTSGTLASIGKCVGPLEDVRRLFFRVLRLPGNTIHIEQGWFQETLPAAREKVGPIALLRMDADWYESTKCILENLFDNVVQGGYVIIDDYYCWEGCKKAVDEFLAKRNIRPRIMRVDKEGAYFQK